MTKTIEYKKIIRLPEGYGTRTPDPDCIYLALNQQSGTNPYTGYPYYKVYVGIDGEWVRVYAELEQCVALDSGLVKKCKIKQCDDEWCLDIDKKQYKGKDPELELIYRKARIVLPLKKYSLDTKPISINQIKLVHEYPDEDNALPNVLYIVNKHHSGFKYELYVLKESALVEVKFKSYDDIECLIRNMNEYGEVDAADIDDFNIKTKEVVIYKLNLKSKNKNNGGKDKC